MLVALLATACVNDDTDFSDLINTGGEPEVITPIDIALDFSDLDESPDSPPADEADPYYNDYEETTTWGYTVNIAFDGQTASLSGQTNRVRVTQNGSHITVSPVSNHVHLVVSGASSNGSLKIYSDYRFKLTLNGLDLTNPTGAAINNQGGKSLYLVLADGTSNTLADGATYSDVAGEDMKGVLFSEGQVIVSGKGALRITAIGRHGLVSDDYIRFRPGPKLHISCTSGHGVKSNDGIFVDGGVLNVEVSGNGCKGFKSDSTMVVNGGRTTVMASGGAVITPATASLPADTSSCAGIKCDYALTVNSGDVLIKATGEGGKGITNDGDIAIIGGSVKVVTTGIKGMSSPKGIKGDKGMSVTGGYVYSYSANSSPLDIKGGLTVGSGYTLWETKPQRVIILF